MEQLLLNWKLTEANVWTEDWSNEEMKAEMSGTAKTYSEYTINNICQRVILQQAKGDISDRVHSDLMVLGTFRQEAGSQKRLLKALKTNLTQGGPSSSSPLGSDGSRDGTTGGWTS
jgi:hypothetical protein